MLPAYQTLMWLVPWAALAAEPVDYPQQVKPLLAARCYACHGALKQESDLRLDTAASIRKGGASGAAVVAGNSSESLLIQRVTHEDPQQRMPPAEEGAPLHAEEVALLKAWIDQGAVGPADEQPEADPREHWAFRPPQRPAVPSPRQAGWARNPIDAFIAAEHDRLGLVPQPEADRRAWLRRVTIDLIGLPPTPHEQEAFLRDASPDAYEKVVQRLLESPLYGQRWGRHWMDIWRYSDWWGLGAEVRNSQKHIWHWRDWIIESLNDDVGYDEMLRQMLAADELYPNDLAKLRATGYLARTYFKFNRNTWLDDTVEHTAKAFLGLTINCSKCHDHKYDPIAQHDYYRFRAFFEPYQIRTDQVPGELDYEKNGIPRVFDCNLDAPTYRFLRGNEKQPITDEPLHPNLPAVLLFEPLQIRPVELPLHAHHPGLRPWVVENHLAAARKKIEAAREVLAQARQALDEAMQAKQPTSESSPQPEPAPQAAPLVQDDFQKPRPQWWDLVAGGWEYAKSGLHQSQTGNQRGVARLKISPPADFEARIQFTIHGGQQWKSVGLTYDVAADREMLVYLSAVSGGSKVQIAYKQGANYTYPTQAMQARAVPLDEPQELLIRVRGTLVNVAVNGQHALAWQSPIARQAGAMELITFDASASFSGFTLAPLAAGQALVEPMSGQTKPGTQPALSLEQAQAGVRLAERTLAAAEAEIPAIEARAAADRARLAQPPADNAADLAVQAAVAQRKLEAAQAAQQLAQAEYDLLRTEPAKREEAAKKVTAARAALEKAEAAVAAPGSDYPPLRGALKTLESNVESEQSRQRPFPTTSTGRRTALARWLTDRRNPLTARVAVNHIWARHFNAPLVPTVFDFGRKGTPPTHPALLDWLAVELMDHQWSMKHLHRLIVLSATYRMTSSAAGADAANLQIDSANRYYWRMNATRMEAQVVRDSLLWLSGELDTSLGGPSVPLAQGESSTRRSLYFVHSHNEHHPLLAMFDDADVLECYRRQQSIIPQQALALANARASLDAADKIAARVAAETPNLSDEDFVRAAFTWILASAPRPEEERACLEALEQWRTALGGNDQAASRARRNLIHALINHNDFITVR